MGYKEALAIFAVAIENLEKVSREENRYLGLKVAQTCHHFVEALENEVTPLPIKGGFIPAIKRD